MDLRAALNAISDVVANRPHPLRDFDQIHMKTADMLVQAEHISKWFNNKDVVFCIAEDHGIRVRKVQNLGEKEDLEKRRYRYPYRQGNEVERVVRPNVHART